MGSVGGWWWWSLGGINQSEADIACVLDESAKPEPLSRKNNFSCILNVSYTVSLYDVRVHVAVPVSIN